MVRPLPSLNALRAFEATARRLSFTEAARELHVTPAALSHQIRGLEERLGLALFHRHTRAIELTEEARLIYPGIHAAFETLRETIERLDRVAPSNVLVVSATPGFTVKWLVPRLYRLLEAHPEIDIRISSSMQKATFEGDGIDVAIRFVLGTLPDHHVEKLAEDTVVPLCSPRLIASDRPLRQPADLARHTLIHTDLPSPFPPMPTWSDWLAEVGLDAIDATRGLRFNTVDHAIDAAVEGAGVTLGQKIIALGDLQAGRLVVPFGPELPIRARGYHFVCPRGRMAQPKVRAFRDWLFAEMAKAAADLGQDFLAGGADRPAPARRPLEPRPGPRVQNEPAGPAEERERLRDRQPEGCSTMSDGSGMQGSAGRDFGDSAGYGGGGSTRDYRDVLGENELRRPNPLDAVMTIPPHRRRAGARGSEGGPARAERDPSSDLVTAAAVMLVASLGVLGWRHARDLRSRRMRRHRRAEGETRETLARLQV